MRRRERRRFRPQLWRLRRLAVGPKVPRPARSPACRHPPGPPADRATTPYRCLASLAIPADCPRPACPGCGALLMSPAVRSVLDRAFGYVLRARIRALLERLAPYVSQRELERRLGLSWGYLSALKAGKCNPSAALVSALSMLAADPVLRLRELERYWAEPPYA